jgi:hypothetical protein
MTMTATEIKMFKPTRTFRSADGAKAWDPRNKLFGLFRAADVNAIYRGKMGQSIGIAAKARSGREIWQMILDAMDHGFATQNNNSSFEGKLSLRALFTNAPTLQGGERQKSYFNRYDLRNPKHREYVQNVIMPAALANKAAVIADPMRLEGFVSDYLREAEKNRVVTTTKELPADEYPAVMYGLHLWPRPSHATYGYTTCRAACRYFEDLLKLCDQSTALLSPKSKAMAIRFSTRAIQRYIDPEILRLTDSIATAMENNPTGECDPPPMPHDHKW